MDIYIEPIHTEGLNCEEDALLSIVAKYSSNHQLLYSQIWGFDLIPEDPLLSNLIGYRISRGSERFSELINKYLDINISISEPNTAREIISEIKKQLLKGMPSITYIDTFWCPWHADYQKLNHAHYIIIVGFDDENNLLCVDSAFSLKNLKLPYDHFVNGCGSWNKSNVKKYASLLLINKQQNEKIINYNNVLYESGNRLFESNLANNIRKFASEFNEKFNFSLEYESFEKNIFDVKIDRRINQVSECRLLYIKFLDYLTEKINILELDNIKSNLENSSKIWRSIKIILRKSYYTGFNDNVRNKIFVKLMEISELEERTIKSLLLNRK